MIQKQRKIGQQIMAVRMIKEANDVVFRGGASFLSAQKLANGMKVEKDEILELSAYCRALDPKVVAIDCAIEAGKKKEDYVGLCHKGIRNYAELIIHKLLRNRSIKYVVNSLEEDCVAIAKEINSVTLIEMTKKGIVLFCQTYIDVIEEMRSNDYDWAVIVEMLGDDFMWRNWFESEDADDWFARLKQICERGDVDEWLKSN